MSLSAWLIFTELLTVSWYLIFPTTLQGRGYYCPHFTNKKTKAQKGKITCQTTKKGIINAGSLDFVARLSVGWESYITTLRQQSLSREKWNVHNLYPSAQGHSLLKYNQGLQEWFFWKAGNSSSQMCFKWDNPDGSRLSNLCKSPWCPKMTCIQFWALLLKISYNSLALFVEQFKAYRMCKLMGLTHESCHYFSLLLFKLFN